MQFLGIINNKKYLKFRNITLQNSKNDLLNPFVSFAGKSLVTGDPRMVYVCVD